MIRIKNGATPAEVPQVAGAQGVRLQVLLGPEQGVPGFVMRLFEVAPGGHTPLHTHEYEHEIYVLEGHGTVGTPDARLPLEPGDAAFVAPDELHQFCNGGATVFRFLCVIPI